MSEGMSEDTITVEWDGPAGKRDLPLPPPPDRAEAAAVLEAALASGGAVKLPGREWRLLAWSGPMAWGKRGSLLAHLWCGPAEGEALAELRVHLPDERDGLPRAFTRRPGMRAVETATRRSLLLESMALERALAWQWLAAETG